jgi:hypothetical protein
MSNLIDMAEVKRYIRQVLNIVQYYKNLDEELKDESDERGRDIPDKEI